MSLIADMGLAVARGIFTCFNAFDSVANICDQVYDEPSERRRHEFEVELHDRSMHRLSEVKEKADGICLVHLRNPVCGCHPVNGHGWDLTSSLQTLKLTRPR